MNTHTIMSSAARGTFGRIDEDGNVVYWTDGYIWQEKKILGKTRKVRNFNPTEEQLNEAGWYRVQYVQEDGTNEVSDTILYVYVGAPAEPEPEEGEETQEP